MKKEIELLAPGGDIDSIKAAIAAGADAIYCGLDRFNARNRAANISLEDLPGIIRLAHHNNCQIFLTLNIIILENEIPAIISLLNKLVNTNIDGIIIQDLGLFYLLSKYFKSLKVHASTQLTTHNEGQILFLNKLNASRANLSRELNIHEIKALTTIAHKNNMETEVFVHGSYCISFSGICYMSSVQSGNSGNRGRCSQPCRDQYETTAAGKNYPLNLKDNSAYFNLKEIADAVVDSIKIEGRIKKYDYVYTVVDVWRKQLQSFYEKNNLSKTNSKLYKVFNRDFSNAYLKGEIHKDMFIDDPRDHSIEHLSEINSYSSDAKKEEIHLELYKEKENIKSAVENKIKLLSIAKFPLTISISGEKGTLLKVNVKTPLTSFEIQSETILEDKGAQPLDYEILMKRLKAINDTGYYIEHLELSNMNGAVYLPFKELTSIKNRILFILNGSKALIEPIKVPVLKKQSIAKIKPILSVVISSLHDLELCKGTSADIYFQLPNGFKNKSNDLVNLFIKNKRLIPWFPSILIGEDYQAAVEFLCQVNSKIIVTDNTGVAYEASLKGIPWIAGPHLNMVNSYSLICLKENFNCAGAFISNELSREQIRNIKKPDDFNLYFSIFHPIELMTSRQCLFHQVKGCNKHTIDNSCISGCEKSANITRMKKETFFIEKTKGNYHKVFHATNYLNMDVVSDFPNLFSGYCIDLRDIKTETKIDTDKSKLIQLFEGLMNGDSPSKKAINEIIHPSTRTPYMTGI